jgi:hypothetical protein
LVLTLKLKRGEFAVPFEKPLRIQKLAGWRLCHLESGRRRKLPKLLKNAVGLWLLWMPKNIETSKPTSKSNADEHQQKNRPNKQVILPGGAPRRLLMKDADRHIFKQ